MPNQDSVRQRIVKAAKWGVENHTHFTYSEGPLRMEAVHKPYQLPITSDCSSWVTSCYSWAGALDPNGLNYNGYGYTGTLLSHGKKIPLAEVQPGDVIVYGPGTGWHTAIIVEAGNDPLTVSMGQNGDPSFVRVSQDGRLPQTYLRFVPVDANIPPAPPSPTPKPPIPKPKPKTISQGDTGPEVRQLQYLLVKKGYKLAIDGQFGQMTDSAARAFQNQHKLIVDGVVGPNTWSALGA